ncbi:MAG: hypothetical protein ACD_73C00080G0001, partial [uncultured bacterium]
ECKKLFFEDLTIMTSMLDARFLAGDEDHAALLIYEIRQLLRSPNVQRKLIQKKLEEKQTRIQKYGGSVFVLEPNVKECAGTLRDLQLPIWIAKIEGLATSYEELEQHGYLTSEELKTLLYSRNFLWRVRNELHLMCHKKVDLLTFQRQESIAPKLDFENDENGILAVEKFMQTYYSIAYNVYTITDKLIRAMLPENSGFSKLIRRIKSKSLDADFKIQEGQIVLKSKSLFTREPGKMLQLFKHVQDQGLPLSPETKDAVTLSSRNINEEFRSDNENIKIFREMMNHYNNFGMVLFAMHETHFLDEWMPEFKKLRCRVQHDMYHIYTIDTHSIFAVNELSKLYAGDYDNEFPQYAQLLAQVKRPEMLTMGLFLHDIGKGEGGNHSVKGAVIAEKVTSRLCYNDEEKKQIDFLIQSHLMMPHISQRRDLDDQDLIIKFARSMENLDKLNMLALLTWADIRAVGPDAWTEWKGSLLSKLYDRAKEVIEKGEFSPEKTREKIARVREALFSKLSHVIKLEDLQEYLSLMPNRYYFACNETEIADHFNLNHQLKTRHPVVCFVKELKDEKMSIIEVIAINTPQMFSHLTGLMLSYGLSIHRADLFLMRNGYVLARLWVTDFKGAIPVIADLSSKIEDDLKNVLTGKIIVSQLIEKRKLPDYLMKKAVQKAKTSIMIDNDVSAYSTVIEIYTHDRLGLLYDIIRTLNHLGCYVEISKISTKVEQVSDVFYVKDIFGHKIMGADKLKAIKDQLKHMIESEGAVA